MKLSRSSAHRRADRFCAALERWLFRSSCRTIAGLRKKNSSTGCRCASPAGVKSGEWRSDRLPHCVAGTVGRVRGASAGHNSSPALDSFLIRVLAAVFDAAES